MEVRKTTKTTKTTGVFSEGVEVRCGEQLHRALVCWFRPSKPNPALTAEGTALTVGVSMCEARVKKKVLGVVFPALSAFLVCGAVTRGKGIFPVN